MSNFFEPGPLTEEAKHAEYFLSSNPFPRRTFLFELIAEADRESIDQVKLFQKMIGLKDTKRILNKTVSLIAHQRKRAGHIMVITDDYAPSFLNIFVVSSYLRKLVIEKENLRMLSALVPFPFVSLEPVKGISKMLVERFLEEDFLYCLHSLLYRVIKAKVSTGAIDLAGIDLQELLKSMEETKGEAIDELFFPNEEEMAEAAEEEEITAAKSEQQNAKEMEESGKVQTSEVPVKELTPEEREAKEKRNVQRKALADLIEESLKESGFDEYVEEAIFIAMEIGLSQALEDLKALLRREYAVKGLLKFAREFYRKAVVLIDMFDVWESLSEREREDFFTGLDWMSNEYKDDLFFVLVTPPHLVEKANRYFQADSIITLNLETARLTETSYDESEPIQSIVCAFLESDDLRETQKEAMKKKKLTNSFPFDESGIEEMIKSTNGETIKIIEAAHELIEAGAKAGYPVIDKKFVSKTLGNG